jgi:hypothetical protein
LLSPFEWKLLFTYSWQTHLSSRASYMYGSSILLSTVVSRFKWLSQDCIWNSVYVIKLVKIASVKDIHCTLFYHYDIYLYSLYHTNALLKMQCLKKWFATVSHIIISFFYNQYRIIGRRLSNSDLIIRNNFFASITYNDNYTIVFSYPRSVFTSCVLIWRISPCRMSNVQMSNVVGQSLVNVKNILSHVSRFRYMY